MSANKASKMYGIPNSSLYKIAKKEGIKLNSPLFINPSWSKDDLNRAFDAIKNGMSVMKASVEFGKWKKTIMQNCFMFQEILVGE